MNSLGLLNELVLTETLGIWSGKDWTKVLLKEARAGWELSEGLVDTEKASAAIQVGGSREREA